MYVVSILLILMGITRLIKVDYKVNLFVDETKKEFDRKGLYSYISDDTIRKIGYAGIITTALVMILGGGYIFIHL